MTRSLYGRDGMGWSRRCGLRYLMRSSLHSRNEPWRPSRSARLGLEPSSTLRDAQRPYSRQWISLGSPGDARLPQTVAPFRRERRTFFVAPVPVDDLVDSDPVPGDRDHERIPHTRRRFCRLLVVEERGVGSLGHPPDDEIVRRHATPTLPPRRAVGRHVHDRPRTRCSWRSHTSSRSGESTSHAWDRWLSSVWTCATTLMRPRFAAFRTTSYVSARDRCRLPRRSCAVAGPWTSKNARSASTARPPNRAMSLPLFLDMHGGGRSCRCEWRTEYIRWYPDNSETNRTVFSTRNRGPRTRSWGRSDTVRAAREATGISTGNDRPSRRPF